MFKRTDEILADAYKKVRDLRIRDVPILCLLQYSIFKIPTLDRWIVIVSGKYIDELYRAPDDVMSFMEAAKEVGLAFQPFAHSPNHCFSKQKVTILLERPSQRTLGITIPFADQ